MAGLTRIRRADVIGGFTGGNGIVVTSRTTAVNLRVVNLVYRIKHRGGVAGAALVGSINVVVWFTNSNRVVVAGCAIAQYLVVINTGNIRP
jgi:hypothetical protein